MVRYYHWRIQHIVLDAQWDWFWSISGDSGLDFEKNSPSGIPYFFDPATENSLDIGIQTMFDVQSTNASAIVVAGENLSASATVRDIRE